MYYIIIIFLQNNTKIISLMNLQGLEMTHFLFSEKIFLNNISVIMGIIRTSFCNHIHIPIDFS